MARCAGDRAPLDSFDVEGKQLEDWSDNSSFFIDVLRVVEIAFDTLGASPGALIGLSEGREAANPFGKDKTPVDAYCACLIDRIDIR